MHTFWMIYSIGFALTACHAALMGPQGYSPMTKLLGVTLVASIWWLVWPVVIIKAFQSR